jgi:hypothetical protein
MEKTFIEGEYVRFRLDPMFDGYRRVGRVLESDRRDSEKGYNAAEGYLVEYPGLERRYPNPAKEPPAVWVKPEDIEPCLDQGAAHLEFLAFCHGINLGVDTGEDKGGWYNTLPPALESRFYDETDRSVYEMSATAYKKRIKKRLPLVATVRKLKAV